ncbi:MAG: hypothetical protein C5B54_00925 [Acidobacteria bacterium]|nr:MAG: hypothetical protein C5B54_00925 [Acidobacteriota bacterium]
MNKGLGMYRKFDILYHILPFQASNFSRVKWVKKWAHLHNFQASNNLKIRINHKGAKTQKVGQKLHGSY